MSRIEELRAGIRQLGAEAMLVSGELNQRYLTGYPFTDGVLLITQEHAFLITDFRYLEEAQAKADPAFEVVVPQSRVAFVTEWFGRDQVSTVAFEEQSVSWATYQKWLTFYDGIHFVPSGGMLEQMREVKSPEELEAIAQAQNIADRAYAELLRRLRPDMTETDVACELDFTMRRLGAQGSSFETIAVSGTASALPHGKPRNIPLERGFLTMDFGALYNGYCSDMTRTVSIGLATSEMKDLYNTVLRAQQEGLARIRAGALCADVDAAARNLIQSSPYRDTFGHGLGHGVGLFIHENPRLSPSAAHVLLKTGNVVTVEPGIYLMGQYGCRIEDMVAVTDEGYSNFTQSPKDLIEIV